MLKSRNAKYLTISTNPHSTLVLTVLTSLSKHSSSGVSLAPLNGAKMSSHWIGRIAVDNVRHRRTGRGGCSPPCRKKNSIIRAKLMYHSGKDSKNILLFNILIYLLSSRNSPNLSNGYVLYLTPWFFILEMLISICRKYLHYFERPCSHGMAKKTSCHERIILCICDQQVLFGQIMFSPPPQQNFSCTPMSRKVLHLVCSFSFLIVATNHFELT